MPYFPALPTCPVSLGNPALPTCPTPLAGQPPAANVLTPFPALPVALVTLLGLNVLARHAARRLFDWHHPPAAPAAPDAPDDAAAPAVFAPPDPERQV